MTQEGVAKAMGTTQAVVARLESRQDYAFGQHTMRFAKATRRLRFWFEP
jgi:hypothetical protein